MDAHWSTRGHGHGHASSGSRPVAVQRTTSGGSVCPLPSPSPSPPPAAAPRAHDEDSFTSARRTAAASSGMAGSGRKRSDSAHSRRHSSTGTAPRAGVPDSSALSSPGRSGAVLSHASLMRQREQLSRMPLAQPIQSSNYTPNFNRVTSVPVYGANSITGQAPQHRWTATPSHTFASTAAIAAASTPARAAHAGSSTSVASSASRSRASSAQPHSRSTAISQSRTQAQSRDNDADAQSRGSSGFSWPISVSLHGCANIAARELIEALIAKHSLQVASEATATLLWTDQKHARSYKSFRTIANTSAWFNGPRAAALTAASRVDKPLKAQPCTSSHSAGASAGASACDRDRPPPPLVRLTNHLPDMHSCVTKSNLGRALAEFQALFPAEFDFFPTSWDLLHQAQARDFQARLEENRQASADAQRTYILKPHAGRQGEGIVLVQRWSEVLSAMQAAPGRHFVASEYISSPALLDGFKFDCRVYVLVQSLQPLRVVLFRDGLARLATAKYAPPSSANLHNPFLHLTNYSVNKHNTAEFRRVAEREGGDWTAVEDENNLSELAQISASKRSIRTALLQLRLQGVPIVIDDFWTQVAAIVDKTMLALWPELQGSYYRHFADRLNVDGPASTTAGGGARPAQPSARNGATAQASRPVSAMPRAAAAAGVGVGAGSRASPSPVPSPSPSPSRSPSFSPALSSSPSPYAASPSPLSGRSSPPSPLGRESGSDSDSDADSSPRSAGSRRSGSHSGSGASTPEPRASRTGATTASRSPPTASSKPASAWGGVSPAARRSSANWTGSNTVVQSAVRAVRDERHAPSASPSASVAPASKTTATVLAPAAAATLPSRPVAAASTYPALSVPPALLDPPAPSHAFHLLGFDILLDSSMRAHLLEVNAAPSMNLDSSLDKRIKLAVLERSFELLGLIPPPPPKGQRRDNLFDPSCDAPEGEESDEEAEEIEAGGNKSNGAAGGGSRTGSGSGSSSVIARPTLYKRVFYGSGTGSGGVSGSSTADPPLSARELQHVRVLREPRRYRVQDLDYTLLSPDQTRRALFPFGAARVQRMFLTFSAKRHCSGLSLAAWNRLLSAYGIVQRASTAGGGGGGGVAGAPSSGSGGGGNGTGASQPDLLFMRVTRARNERLMSFASFCQALLALAALRHPHASAIDAFHMLVADVDRRVRHREAERAARTARAEAARKAAAGPAHDLDELAEDEEAEGGEAAKKSNVPSGSSGSTASHSSSPSLASSPLHSPSPAPRRTVSGNSGGAAMRDMSSPHGSPKSPAARSLHLSGGRSAPTGASGGVRAPSGGPVLSTSLLSSVNAAMHLAASHAHAHPQSSPSRPFSSDHHRSRTHALHAATSSTAAAAASWMAVPAGVDRPYVAHLDDPPRARNASSNNGYTSYPRRAF